MGSSEEGLTPREAVLIALDAAGGKVESRTALQKIMYFVALALDEDLDHRAHYFGPYSRTVEYALAQTALSDEVSEMMERYPSYTSGPDIRKYIYELTTDGEEVVADARSAHAQEADVIRGTLEAVHEAVPNFDQQTLSMAAKIHFIVTQRDESTKLNEIPNLAKQLGWRISDAQVQQSVDLLQRLDLITVN